MKYICNGKSSRLLRTKILKNYLKRIEDNTYYSKSWYYEPFRFGRLKKIGGKTIVFNQLAPTGYSKTGNGGTAFETGTRIIAGNKYYIAYKRDANNSTTNCRVYVRADGTNRTLGEILPVGGALESKGIYIAEYGGVSNGTAGANEGNAWMYQNTGGANITVTNLMIVDLTTTFGAGNEPTLAECEQIFVNDNYPHNDGELKSAAVNNIQIGTGEHYHYINKKIPVQVQALDGYGMSAGNVYNSIEFDSGKVYFHKRVASVDLGTLNYERDTSYSGDCYYFYFQINNAKKGVEQTKPNLICPLYDIVNSDFLTRLSLNDKELTLYNNNNTFCVRNDTYTTAAAFKTAMAGVMLQYELAEEKVIDITRLFARNFDYFNIEGDTLDITFENSLNGLHIPIPNAEEFYFDPEEE